jgi:hypothetical protein
VQATPLPLPVADVIKTASVHDWLSRFAECVRAVDYAAARPLLAFRHRRVWHLSGTGARLDCLDGDPMGQRMAEN